MATKYIWYHWYMVKNGHTVNMLYDLVLYKESSFCLLLFHCVGDSFYDYVFYVLHASKKCTTAAESHLTASVKKVCYC